MLGSITKFAQMLPPNKTSPTFPSDAQIRRLLLKLSAVGDLVADVGTSIKWVGDGVGYDREIVQLDPNDLEGNGTCLPTRTSWRFELPPLEFIPTPNHIRPRYEWHLNFRNLLRGQSFVFVTRFLQQGL